MDSSITDRRDIEDSMFTRDRAALNAWRSGDSSRGLELLDAYRPYFMALCSRYGVRREDDQVDLYQEILMRLLRQLPKLELKSSFGGYLRRVFHTAYRETRRAQSRSSPATESSRVGSLPSGSLPSGAVGQSVAFGVGGAEPVDRGPAPDERLAQHEILFAIEECSGELEEKERFLFEARLNDQIESSKLCEMMQVTANHLHVLYHRVRQKMRSCLSRKGFEA